MVPQASLTTRIGGGILSLFFVVAVAATPARAQNWSTDARSIALGSGSTEIDAFKMAQEERPYKTLTIPLGLIQVVPRWSVFKAGSDQFDPVRAIGYASGPLHFKFAQADAGDGSPQASFIRDIVDASLDRNLNAYRGFRPATNITAEGLASPSWGKTIKVRGEATGFFHGVYVGAGPYLSVKTTARIDEDLADLLGSPTDLFVPSTSFDVGDTTTAQLAMAVTGGYRARLAMPGGARNGGRDGIYVAANYHYLHGFRYEDFDINVTFDTDSAGLMTVAPATEPVSLDRLTSRSGRGFAVDLSVAMVANGWELGFGANGLANRINWQGVERQTFVLESLLGGGDFIETTYPAYEEARRIELPVDYSANAGYSSGAWSGTAQYSRGLGGGNFRGGVEYRLGTVALRGGVRLSGDRWHPTAGAGFNLTPKFGVDVAVFATSNNIERRRDPSVALSLRFNR